MIHLFNWLVKPEGDAGWYFLSIVAVGAVGTFMFAVLEGKL